MTDTAAPSLTGYADTGHPHGPGYRSQAEHTLRLSAWCSATGVTLSLAAVVLGADGAMRPTLYTLTPTNDGLKTTSPSLPLEDGVLASVHVFASAGTPIGAQCFARVELLQGREGATQSLGTVLQGYVTLNAAVAYPGDNTARPVDGAGTWRIVLGTAPAAGAEIVETVPANRRWQLEAFRFKLTASAVVANRTPVLFIDDGVNIVWETENPTAITATQVATYNAGAGVQNGTLVAPDFQLALPETLVLPAGARIRTLTGNIQAGDQYAAPVYNVAEWFDV
jgi:hypothetical protein